MELYLKHLDVLDTEIPVGAHGRRLSADECRKLQDRGIACDDTYLVVRTAVDTPELGYLYKPIPTSERFTRIGVMVGYRRKANH